MRKRVRTRVIIKPDIVNKHQVFLHTVFYNISSYWYNSLLTHHRLASRENDPDR